MLIIPNLPRICNHPTWILRIFFINRMLKLGFWNRHWIIDSNCGPHRMYVVDLKQAFWWPCSKVDCIRLSDVSWWLSILLFFYHFGEVSCTLHGWHIYALGESQVHELSFTQILGAHLHYTYLQTWLCQMPWRGFWMLLYMRLILQMNWHIV